MEISVEVHTVHPTSSKPIHTHNTLKGTYGSWCTPESSPTHHILSKTVSNIETKTNIKDDTGQYRDKRIFPLQKVRLFPGSPPPTFKPKNDVKEIETELKDLKNAQIVDNFLKRTSPDRKSVQIVETPQSPVPSSPSRNKKCKGLTLPASCDPFIPIDPQETLTTEG
ncbi:uncharacterized protein [Battus philenor]|uniref:uncharacterized protein n=1 Tax=Battus philenor TaxID=42288 RepID=UPI0035D0E4BF